MKRRFICGAIVLAIVAVYSNRTISHRIQKSKYKESRIYYYVKNGAKLLVPNSVMRNLLCHKFEKVNNFDREYISDRVNYYNKVENRFALPKDVPTLKDFRKEKKNFYFFDLFDGVRFFPPSNQVSYLFGDISTVPEVPSIVKSRPIGENNERSVLFKLDKLRHFIFVKDQKQFEQKKNRLVWRGAAHQHNRIDFLRKFKNHYLCNVADTKPGTSNFLTMDEQLDYQFILSLEGNDVATNLKWIMSSNSLCFAPKPKFETWFMEGRLIPNYHYVLIEDDYSDLVAKIEYYIQHRDEALAIIANANRYVEQFKNQEREELISLLVLDKYFRLSSL